MFEKKHRLAKSKDVKNTLSRGRSFFNSHFSVKFAKKFEGVSRFTVVVSTKVSKKAVLRNRLKRLTREHIRLQVKNFEIGDYALMVKPVASKCSDQELLAKLSDVLTKLIAKGV